ncbi:gamma-glutamyltransferase [Planctomycetota bacterium]
MWGKMPLFISLLVFAGSLGATPIDSITVDDSGIRPKVTSITVGDFTVTSDKLAFGVSTEAGSIDESAPDYDPETLPEPLVIVDDLFTYMEVYNACAFTTDFTGFSEGGYRDRNGPAEPDFFLLESTGQDPIVIFVTYSIGGGPATVGNSIYFYDGDWGETGPPYGYYGQDLVGIAMDVTDFLDDTGTPLPSDALILSFDVGGCGSGMDAQVLAVYMTTEIAVSNISPADWATAVPTYTDLCFQPPANALFMNPDVAPNLKGPFMFDVYFSPHSSNLIWIPPSIGPVDSNNVICVDPFEGELLPGTTYYWRVDINDLNEPGEPCFYEGAVYSFTTWGYAINPEPENGAQYIFSPSELSWVNDGYALWYNVYFGDDYNEVDQNNIPDAIVFAGEEDDGYDPGELGLGESYYWRVDECNIPGCVHGDVWSFSTACCGQPGTVFLDADVNGPLGEADCYVNFIDYAGVASEWLANCGPDNDWCDGADIDMNGMVDLNDIGVLALQWLWCTDPANPDCHDDEEIQRGWYATGYRGAVSAGWSSTVEAGIEILTNGGNAFDGAAAALLAVGAGEQHFGSEIPIIIYDNKRDVVEVLSGQGPAPAMATLQYYIDNHGGSIPGSGGNIENAPLPGLLLACLTLLHNYGTISFEEAVSPMLDLLGSTGWEGDLKSTLNELISVEQAEIAGGGSREDGLMAVRDYFYNGPIADEIETWMITNGGLIRKSDMANYAANWTPVEEPVSVDYRDYTVYKCNIWTQGPYLLETMQILEGYDLQGMGHNNLDYVHTLIEAMKLGFADRDEFYGDPLFVEVPLEALFSEEYADIRRPLIDPCDASFEIRPGDPYNILPLLTAKEVPAGPEGPVNDTTTCIVADRWGNVVVATPSGWGGTLCEPLGIWFSSRLISFNTWDGHPNVIEPGKRPRITLTPSLVLKNGKPSIGISVSGGDWQDQAALNLFMNLAEFGYDTADAITVPRFGTMHFTGSFSQPPPQLGVMGLPPILYNSELRSQLESRGHIVTEIGSNANMWPSIMVFNQDTGLIEAAGDPAAGRNAAAY